MLFAVLPISIVNRAVGKNLFAIAVVAPIFSKFAFVPRSISIDKLAFGAIVFAVIVSVEADARLLPHYFAVALPIAHIKVALVGIAICIDHCAVAVRDIVLPTAFVSASVIVMRFTVAVALAILQHANVAATSKLYFLQLG